MSINRVVISGNLTRDPELRMTASGMPVLAFGVAVNDRRKNQQTGEWEDYPNFIDCTMFGNRAQSLSQYLSKGTKVALEGKLRWSQWEKNGDKRSKIEVIVDELELMQQRQGAPQPQPTPSAAQYQPQGYSTAPMASQPAQAPQQGYYAAQPTAAVAYPVAEPIQVEAQAVQTTVYDEDIPF